MTPTAGALEIPAALRKRLRKSADETKYLGNIEFFLQDMAPRTGSRILEIGGGEGLLLAMLCRLGFDASALEPVDKYVDVARQLLKHNGIEPSRISQGCAEKMPYPDSSFDYVISYYTLEHVRDLDATFREVERVLKPGGGTFHICPNYNSFFEGHFKVIMLPVMSKTVFKAYVGILKALSLGRSRMPSPAFADSLCFVRPALVRRISESLSTLKLHEADGGAISVNAGRMVFGNRKASELSKPSWSRRALYGSVEALNCLRLGGMLYALMVHRKWYPNLKISGRKSP